MTAVDVVRLADLGVSALIVAGLIYLVVWGVPKFLRERRLDREEELKREAGRMEMLATIGKRLADAQEKQAAAVQTLAECQARHEGVMGESMDALQIAVSSVDQRAATVSHRFEKLEIEFRELRSQVNVITTIPEKLDAVLQRLGDPK